MCRALAENTRGQTRAFGAAAAAAAAAFGAVYAGALRVFQTCCFWCSIERRKLRAIEITAIDASASLVVSAHTLAQHAAHMLHDASRRLKQLQEKGRTTRPARDGASTTASMRPVPWDGTPSLGYKALFNAGNLMTPQHDCMRPGQELLLAERSQD